MSGSREGKGPKTPGEGDAGPIGTPEERPQPREDEEAPVYEGEERRWSEENPQDEEPGEAP